MDAKRKAVALALATSIAIPMEGLRTYAYRDPGPAIWTICYGETIGVKQGDRKTPEECRVQLDKEMGDAIRSVESCRAGLPINVLAAFSDAVYNLGPAIACDTAKSTAARYLKAGNYDAACRELPRWNRATIMGVKTVLPGLTKRREMERDLCLS